MIVTSHRFGDLGNPQKKTSAQNCQSSQSWSQYFFQSVFFQSVFLPKCMFAKCSWLTHLIHANLITSHRRCWQSRWRCANILNPRWPTGMIENIFGMRRYILWTSQSATPYQSFINVANYQVNLLVAPWNSVLICRNYIMLPKHTCLKSSLINPHPIFNAIKILSIPPLMLKAFFANVIVKHLT